MQVKKVGLSQLSLPALISKSVIAWESWILVGIRVFSMRDAVFTVLPNISTFIVAPEGHQQLQDQSVNRTAALNLLFQSQVYTICRLLGP